jgi:hypothetical protein
MKNEDFNEMAYTELILSVDVRRSSGKVAFSIIKEFKNWDYTYGNSVLVKINLKNKFDPDFCTFISWNRKAS